MERLAATAQEQQRAVTGDEFRAITGVVNVPNRRNSVHRGTTRFRYDEVNVQGDRAAVIYDDGGAVAHAVFVKTPGGWRVAGITAITVHS